MSKCSCLKFQQAGGELYFAYRSKVRMDRRRPETSEEFVRLRAENQTNEPEKQLHNVRLYRGTKGRTIGLSSVKILSALNA